MEIFLDTADVSEVKQGKAWGLVDGVTTNPSLAAKAGKEFRSLVREIAEIIEGPTSAEVVATDARGMIEQGLSVREIHDEVVVKVPLTEDGLMATKALSDDGHPVNVTLCFSPLQGMLAMKAGATYLSPFVGRLDDQAQDGMDLINQLVTIRDNYGYATKILVASVRSPTHVLDAALMGADTITMPFKVLRQMVRHPLTDSGLATFLDDWKKSGLEL